jgi:hypothetical protein
MAKKISDLDPIDAAGIADLIPIVSGGVTKHIEARKLLRSDPVIKRKTIGTSTYTLLAEDAGSLLLFTNNCTVTLNDSMGTDEMVAIYAGTGWTVTLVESGIDLIGSATVSPQTTATLLDTGGAEITRLS